MRMPVPSLVLAVPGGMEAAAVGAKVELFVSGPEL